MNSSEYFLIGSGIVAAIAIMYALRVVYQIIKEQQQEAARGR